MVSSQTLQNGTPNNTIGVFNLGSQETVEVME
jgi:hypothetical protein